MTAIREETTALRGQVIDERGAAAALAAFTPIWEALTPQEQARLLHLLLERVDYDAAAGQLSLTFCPTGIQTLTDQIHGSQEKRA